MARSEGSGNVAAGGFGADPVSPGWRARFGYPVSEQQLWFLEKFDSADAVDDAGCRIMRPGEVRDGMCVMHCLMVPRVPSGLAAGELRGHLGAIPGAAPTDELRAALDMGSEVGRDQLVETFIARRLSLAEWRAGHDAWAESLKDLPRIFIPADIEGDGHA